MKCEVHEADLSALLDGELGALEERRVRDHLAICRECRRLYTEFEKTSCAVREIEAAAEPARSPEFIDRVIRASVARPRLASTRVVRFPSPLIAAAVLLFLIGLSAAVLERALSSAPVTGRPPLTDDDSAARVLAEARAARDSARALAPGDPRGFDPIPVADLGERGPDLPDPSLFGGRTDPLTGEDLYRNLGLARAGGRWLSGDAYRRMRDHLEQEELLARAAEMNAAETEVATVARGNAVTAWVGALHPGTAVTHASLTLVPLLDGDGETGVQLLDLAEALKTGILTIREDRSSARLAAENRDEVRHVFIPAGTVLIGGYQDRVITRDTLLPPKTRARLPVLCCEEDRSVGVRDEFASSPGLAPADIRQILLSSRDQDEVWRKIKENLEVLGARNRTNALKAIFEKGPGARKAEAYSRALADALSDPRTVGVLAFHNGELMAGDIFSSHALLTVMAPRLATSYALDSLRRENEGVAVATGLGQPGEILASVLRASYLRIPGAVGGQESVFSGGISGSALIPVADAKPLHVVLFPEPAEETEPDSDATDSKTGDEAGQHGPDNPPPPDVTPPSGEAKRRIDKRQAERRAGGNTPRKITPPKRPDNSSPGRDPRKEPEAEHRIPDSR